MVTVADRARRVQESRDKICPPFELDEELCLYCPQDNVDSLSHPRIAEWIDFIKAHYEPELPAAKRTLLLMLPCTKTKPYPFSLEHKRINRALLSSGFKPAGAVLPPPELAERLEAEFPPEVLNLAPLINGDGVVIHRAVISEPLAFVPYELVYSFRGGPSPATSYDDPGLFEKRGNAASPWRPDSSATRDGKGRWHWGDEEKRAYVRMHNAMAELLAAVLGRLSPRYDALLAWVAPGLTHRSFILEAAQRRANGVPAFRKAFDRRLALTGANDLLAGGKKIVCLPTPEQCTLAIDRLATRLGRPVSQVGGAYSRGGGGATPLALPELLDQLLDVIAKSARS